MAISDWDMGWGNTPRADRPLYIRYPPVAFSQSAARSRGGHSSRTQSLELNWHAQPPSSGVTARSPCTVFRSSFRSPSAQAQLALPVLHGGIHRRPRELRPPPPLSRPIGERLVEISHNLPDLSDLFLRFQRGWSRGSQWYPFETRLSKGARRRHYLAVAHIQVTAS